ncbi:hypothetical protein BH18ACT3_BH18ACT3_13210 [soil metagenome]
MRHPLGTVLPTGFPSKDVQQPNNEGGNIMSEHNLVILRAQVTSKPRVTELASGTDVVQYDVKTVDGAGTVSVPVSWFDAPGAGRQFGPGDDVVVIGSVRRRFFRSGGATVSRTDVVADEVLSTRRQRAVQRSVDLALAQCQCSQSP